MVTNLPTTVHVPENTAASTTIFTVTKSDANALDTHTWTSTSSPTSGDLYFTIDPNSKTFSNTKYSFQPISIIIGNVIRFLLSNSLLLKAVCSKTYLLYVNKKLQGKTYWIILFSKAGAIKTSSINIDFETIGTTTFLLIAYVSDGQALDSGTVTISIINQNETPMFLLSTYTITGNESTVRLVQLDFTSLNPT